MTFLTPVDPNDPIRQSLPFSYYEISVASTSHTSHKVELYTDIASGKIALSKTASKNDLF